MNENESHELVHILEYLTSDFDQNRWQAVTVTPIIKHTNKGRAKVIQLLDELVEAKQVYRLDGSHPLLRGQHGTPYKGTCYLSPIALDRAIAQHSRTWKSERETGAVDYAAGSLVSRHRDEYKKLVQEYYDKYPEPDWRAEL